MVRKSASGVGHAAETLMGLPVVLSHFEHRMEAVTSSSGVSLARPLGMGHLPHIREGKDFSWLRASPVTALLGKACKIHSHREI